MDFPDEPDEKIESAFDPEDSDLPEGWGTGPQPPVFPVEMVFDPGGWMFGQEPDGFVTMKVMGLQLVPTPQGIQQIPVMPVVRMRFDPAAWERFKRQVAADGVPPPAIPVAAPGALDRLQMPPGWKP